MPSGTYGRGGRNFATKPKSPAIIPDASTKSSNPKSNEKVSLLKKIVHAMPGSGSQSNKSQSQSRTTSAGSQPHPHRDIPTRYNNTIPRQSRGRGSSTLPARPKTSPGSHPPPAAPLRISFAEDASHSSIGMDTAHRNRNGNGNGNGRTPAVNLHTLTPSSSEDERSDLEISRSVRPLSPNDIPPFTSRQASTDNEGTAVNEGPFPAPEVPRTVKVPLISVTRNRVRVRSSSLDDDFLRRTAPSQPQPEREAEDSDRTGDQKKALAALEGNLGSPPPTEEGKGNPNPNHRPVINDNNDKKRGHRITLATPATTIPRIIPAPARRPTSELSSFADLLPSNLNEHTCRWSETLISVSVPGAGATSPPSDPFNHLFTSCVISLILLIILAAGKDILYVIALLPVLMTLAKHFLDLNQLGLYTPLMRNNLESLLSI